MVRPWLGVRTQAAANGHRAHVVAANLYVSCTAAAPSIGEHGSSLVEDLAALRFAVMTAAAVLQALRDDGSTWRAVRRLGGGVQEGAWLVSDAAGSRAVLKFRSEGWARRVETAEMLVRIARRQGWPAPAWLDHGVAAGSAWHLEEFVPGRRPRLTTAEVAREILQVNDRQAGVTAPGHSDTWSQYAMHVVFGDSDQRRGLEAADGVPAHVAHRVRQAAQGFDKFRLPSNDLVHGDFRTANFRFARGRLLAVIDNDTAGPGCRCLDLATVLLEAQMRGSAKAARVIGQHGLARFGSRMLTVCLAWQVLEMAYFGLRRWPRSELDRYCSACIDLLEHAQEDRLAGFSTAP